MELDHPGRRALLDTGSPRTTEERVFSHSRQSSFHSCLENPEDLEENQLFLQRRLRTFYLDCGGKFCIAAAVFLAALVGSIYLWYYPAWTLMKSFESQQVNADDWWWILMDGSIPLVAAIVGWGTNAVAISMTFYPFEYTGCFPKCQFGGMPLCGWQGIIPQNCRRMATQAVDLMTSQLFDANEAASSLDPAELAREARPALEEIVPVIIDTIAKKHAPQKWERMPKKVKDEIISKCLEKSSSAISNMSAKPDSSGEVVSESSLQLMKDVLIDLLVADKQLVNDIFLQCAGKEYKFIRVSGFYLGFLFGLAQMWLWNICKKWYILPIAGFLVGYLTNYVALKCIFQPIDPIPVKICGRTFKIQGLFLKRQQEVATVYSELFSTKVLTAENLLVGMIKRKESDELFAVLDEAVQQGIDSVAKKVVLSRRLAQKMIGKEEYQGIKNTVCALIREERTVMQLIRNVTPYIDQILNVKSKLYQNMLGMSTQEFADMLLPAFQEGELKLIIIGGVLGALVGMMQAVVQVPEQIGLAKTSPYS